MKNKHLFIEAVNYRRGRKCKTKSTQYKIVDWLLENEGQEFTVQMFASMFKERHRTISSCIRNLKAQYGLILKRKEIGPNSFIYKVVDCNFERPNEQQKPKSKPSLERWQSVLNSF